MKTVKVVVHHAGYGCETGCCGHIVRLADDPSGDQLGNFEFIHPWDNSEEVKREWALAFAQEQVRAKYGADHVADLDWENSTVVDD